MNTSGEKAFGLRVAEVTRTILAETPPLIAQYFQRFWDVWTVIKLCRFNFLLPVLVGFFLIVGPNGQELLLRMQYETTAQSIFFLVILVVWGVMVWYWARVILSFQFWNWPPKLTEEDAKDQDARRRYEKRRKRIFFWHLWIPRICGSGAIGVVAYALALTSQDMQEAFGTLGGLFYVSAGLALAVLAFVWLRRSVFPGLFLSAEGQEQVGLLDYRAQEPSHVKFYTHFRQLPWSTLILLVCSFLVLSGGMFVLFAIRDVNLIVAPNLGAPTILLLAATAWIPAGTVVMYWANHYRVPIFTILVVYVALISAYNDDHHVRTLTTQPISHPTLEARFTEWVKKRISPANAPQQKPDRRPTEVPVFVIAADGGGIRAAYWTASVLARIQQDNPQFAAHTFAISGVSGGSLGAALFDALLNEQESANTRCHIILGCVRAMLSRDFVAPTLATMLYPDLVQRFVPRAFPSWDRGTTLESAWEQAWKEIALTDRFAQKLEELWANDSEYTIPSLVLNSTSVEQGNRVLTSNLQLRSCPSGCVGRTEEGPFHDIIDYHSILNVPTNKATTTPGTVPVEQQTVRLSTAAHSSARFTYVSPAGTVNPNLHIVDGGYFENSGTTTAAELIMAIETLGRKLLDQKDYVIRPMVIHISNDPQSIVVTGTVIQVAENGGQVLTVKFRPADSDPQQESLQNDGIVTAWIRRGDRLASTVAAGKTLTLELDETGHIVGLPSTTKRRYLLETLAPFITFLHTRDARATYSTLWLKDHVEPQGQTRKNFFHFGLIKGPVALPLGWTLSKPSMDEMDAQLNEYFVKDCAGKDKLPVQVYFETCITPDFAGGN